MLLPRLSPRRTIRRYIRGIGLYPLLFILKKVEEVVRKNMLAELNRDRAEAKADRNDAKIQSE